MTTQTMPTCKAEVPQSPGSYLFRDCGIIASFHEADPDRTGKGVKLKWYCRRHAPSIVAAKSAARNAAWDAKWAAERAEAEAKQRQQAEDYRKLAAYPALVAACRAAYDLDIAQDAYDGGDLVEAKDVFAAWGLSSLDPDDALRELRAQVSTLLRDALTAAGESAEPESR